jgi:hypothetical protein
MIRNSQEKMKFLTSQFASTSHMSLSETTQKQLKLTVLCSAAQREILDFISQFDSIVFLPRSEIFWNCQQKQLKLTVFCSAAQ